jgi:hypothetical protein
MKIQVFQLFEHSKHIHETKTNQKLKNNTCEILDRASSGGIIKGDAGSEVSTCKSTERRLWLTLLCTDMNLPQHFGIIQCLHASKKTTH